MFGYQLTVAIPIHSIVPVLIVTEKVRPNDATGRKPHQQLAAVNFFSKLTFKMKVKKFFYSTDF